MKKSITIIVLAIVLIIITSVSIYLFLQKSESDICLNIQGNSKDICYSELAMKQKDITLCDKEQSYLNKYPCYTDVARAKADIKICQQLRVIEQRDQNGSNHYSNLCYGLLAQTLKQSSLCESIIILTDDDKSAKDYCIKSIF